MGITCCAQKKKTNKNNDNNQNPKNIENDENKNNNNQISQIKNETEQNITSQQLKDEVNDKNNNNKEKDIIENEEIIKLKEKKDEFKKRYENIKNEINIIEREEYYNKVQLYISQIKTDFNENSQIDSKFMDSAFIKKEIIKRDIFLIEQINNGKNEISEYLDKIKNENINEINSKYNILDNYFEQLEKLLQNNSSIKTDLDIKISNELNNLEEIKEINYPEIKNQIEERKNNIESNLNNVNKYNEVIVNFLNKLKEEEELDELFINNWIEKCYIDNGFDLYEIYFEFKCKIINNENKRTSSILEFIPLPQNKLIEMIEFKIDDKLFNNYQMNDSKLTFKEEMKFKNSDTQKFYIKYKQSKIENEGEKKQRKYYRKDNFGLSSIVKGRFAIFHLILNKDWEVINFEDEIFTQVSDNDYQLDGIVPSEGKSSNVILSRKFAKIQLNYTKTLESKDKKPIFNTKMKLNYIFEKGGNKNNQITLEKSTSPKIAKQRILKRKENIY